MPRRLPSDETSLGHRVLTRALRGAERAMAAASQSLDLGARRARFTRGALQFRGRPDDVWVATYPRSGTTWMLYLLHRLERGDAAFDHLDDVCPWFERGLAIGTWDAARLEALPSPRIFKTHLLPRWVPAPGRIVVVERDGLDVAASYHALYRDYLGFDAGFDAFFERFVAGRVQYGAWFSHVRAWRDSARADAWVRYDELRADPVARLGAVARALGWTPSDAALREACAAGSLSQMRSMQPKFDHATALLRERGVTAGAFIRSGRGATIDAPHRRERLQRAAAGGLPRAPLSAFLY